MGSVMQVYLADLARLKAAVGSKDAALLDAITATWPNETTDGSEDGTSGGRLSSRAALRAVIDGGPFEQGQSLRYLDALESICAHIGEHIDDFTFHHGALDELDEEFDVLEGLSIEDFLYEWWDLFPDLTGGGGGYWTKEKCAEALDEWASDDPEDFDELNRTALDELECSDLWLVASKRAGKDVVTFWG
ncbi:hypothetical protein AB0I30_17675 [Nocardia tengchongensis]|uniref:DUF7691 family protein n=1 Tax=Nocardia tengchongensis TaxID=2055889 RepID=UPI0033FEAEFE